MPCQYIYIYKGDDTNWNNEQFVTINVTPAEGSEIDLTDMKAKFILGSYSKEYDLTTGSFTVDLSAAVTDVYAFGPINGIVRVYDTQNRVKTITNTIPFYVTDQVIAEQHQSIDLEVPEGSTVDINVTVGGQVSYNDLTDKPSINGVTVEGDKSGYDYGLADVAGLALKVSKSGDTMSGNLVLEQGVGIETPNAKIHEVNNKLVLGNKSNNYGLYVNPNGTGAAFVSSQGNADVLKSTDLRNTFDPNSTYPITGQGVSQAISSKQDTITGAATTITSSNLSANKALTSDNSGKVAASTVTATELGYVSGVTGAIQTQINNEVNARTNADNDLQGQIDAISAASDVTDIVGTYAELQAYDTQHLKDNDIIKVLTDSTHDNASTYYRWSTHTQTFTYIGAEGPYYTKAEADAEFLSQSDAATTYLTQANAASTYVSKTGNEAVAGNKDFTGTLTAVTPNAGDNSQKVATTAFVNSAIANAPVDGGVANNGYYEEKDLGTWESVADVEAFLSTHKVSTGKFGSLKLGNYVTIKDGTYNKKWAIAGFDVHLSVGDTALNTHHIALFPKNNLLSARMNETNTTAGGYAGSEMHTVTIPAVVENLQTVLGAHLLKHRRLLSNSVATSAASGAGAGWTGSSNAWAWADVYACLLTEPQLYGTRSFSSGAYDVGEGAYQLPLFRFISHVKYSREWFWLRAVASTTVFCGAPYGGTASSYVASNSFGVRPLILIG